MSSAAITHCLNSKALLLHSLLLSRALNLQAKCFVSRLTPLWQAIFCFFLLLHLQKVSADDSPADLLGDFPSTVSAGSYLPPLDSTDNIALASPNGMFTLRIQAWRDSPASYCMAGVTNVRINPGSMIWGANNAQPLMVSSTCRLFLSPQGDLLLQHDGNHTAWQTHTAGMGISNLTLHDSGNLVLHTKEGVVIWQSFTQSPAFAWSSGMNLTSNIAIFSSAPVVNGVTSFNVPGSFALQLHNHSTLVLFTNSNDSSARFVYWSTSFTTDPRRLSRNASSEQVSYVALADDGSFTFYDNSSQALGSIAPSLPPAKNALSSALRVAILDPPSANLLAFYRANHTWVMFYNSSITACENPTQCGSFSLCNSSTGTCTCPPGFVQNSAHDCEPGNGHIFLPSTPCSSAAVEANSYRFLSVNVSFPSQLSAISSTSVENCTSLCIDSCVCRAALFDPGASSCSLFSHLQTLPSRADSKQLMLLKVVAERRSLKKRLAQILGAIGAAIAGSLCLICTAAAICCSRWRKRKRDAASSTGVPNEESFLQALPRLPPRYTYKELKEATKGFSKKLGAGGFGAVYEGELPSAVKVAVKKLEGIGQSSVQFRAEVASIGSVSHVNLVTLKGFCNEGNWRLLVYEHMERGSLDRWLLKGGDEEKNELGWQRRCKIALDTARGLAYLHHECGEKIVHCDVKPENILLDDEFNAKVGDFGLAKLVGHGQQSFALTTIKGTRGYLAPEWLRDATITAKSDVYSFGIVLLELISGRRCLDSDYGYLPTIAFRMFSVLTSSAKSGLADSKNAKLPQSHQDDMTPTSASSQFLSFNGSKESLPPESSTSHDRFTTREQFMSDAPPMHPHYASAAASHMPSQPNSCQHHNTLDPFRMAALLDSRLSADVDVSATSLERMISIALWCVQPNPGDRPSMSAVVQMMEGVAEVPRPPLQSAPSADFSDTLTSSFHSLVT